MIRSFFVGLIALCGAGMTMAETELDAFPYPLVAVDGVDAFAEWQALRSGEGTPIILGGSDQVLRIQELFHSSFDGYYDPLEKVIADAEAQSHPDALYDHRLQDHRLFLDSLKADESDWAKQALAELEAFDPLAIPDDYWGDWPSSSGQTDRLISLIDWETGLPAETVYIAILPTQKPWEAPAYLRFGGWNSNPPPYVHTAAFRHWAETYGAVPVVIQSDVIEFHVTDPPKGREAASALAREQYIYCNDIVDQGVGDLSTLAALLDGGHFWYFWWD